MTHKHGLSKARLAHMQAVMRQHVERGELPGMVTVVRRGDEMHVDAIGVQTLGSNAAMRRDTLFRISSMTKPIVAVATMILVEECMMRLDEPVERWLPELAERTVLNQIDGPLNDTHPAKRPITVRDLLTLRMGFGFILTGSETPIQRAASALHVMPGPPKPQTRPAPDEWMRRFATLPLMYQPGERWMYPTGFSVLGVLLARVAGQPLEQFLHERIFAPLGMKDTGFSVAAHKLDRFASCYTSNPDTGGLELYDGINDSQWRDSPVFPDAEGGLVSTIDDYLAFSRVMQTTERRGHERMLSRASIELMTTNQITPDQAVGSDVFLGDNRGWGFGVSIITRRDDVASAPGRFGWDGGLGTSWYVDPKENVTAILMTQVLGFPSGIDRDFWTSVYQAIED